MKFNREHITQNNGWPRFCDDLKRSLNAATGKVPYARDVFILIHPVDWDLFSNWLITQPGWGEVKITKEFHGTRVVVSTDIEEELIHIAITPILNNIAIQILYPYLKIMQLG